MEAAEKAADQHDVKLTAKRLTLLKTALVRKDENAAPVIKKLHKAGKVKPNPIVGLFEIQVAGKARVAEYEPDTDLRDTEQVPLLEDGGIEAFLRREVLPYAPDAWIDESATKIGYEVSFTKYFYKPTTLRTLKEIRADIEATEKEGQGLLDELFKVAPQ
jgi:type I restriction enzyme M protein